MSIVNRLHLLPRANQQPNDPVYMVILHDTAGPSIKSAENTLVERKLGYHYMIDRDGTVYQYAHPHERMNHAAGWNHGTVGISYVGGGGYGPVNDVQIAASLDLIIGDIKPQAPDLREITGHKHVSQHRKIDPEFEGELSTGIDPKIDATHMQAIAYRTGLRFRSTF